MVKKIVVISVALIICLGLFSGCVDYGYEFYFSVIGENGSISTEWGGDTSPARFLGNKNGHSCKFIATPNRGHQVKEWTLNGEIVEGNKSNTFTARIEKGKYSATITVEFEPIEYD